MTPTEKKPNRVKAFKATDIQAALKKEGQRRELLQDLEDVSEAAERFGTNYEGVYKPVEGNTVAALANHILTLTEIVKRMLQEE
jgi:ABC-type taurine transport system substrate-binding protein